MLEIKNDAICEVNESVMTTTNAPATGNFSNYAPYYEYPYSTHTIQWHTWPIYVCTDRTEKAIHVLKTLEEEKIIKVTSVKKFIELVEKIKNLL